MEQQNTNTAIPLGEANKRPTFLLVLCILSLVGITFVILSSVYSLLTYSTTAALLDKFGTHFNNLLDSSDLNSVLYLTKFKNYVDLFAAVVCLAGVLLMFYLKKIGYFIYIIGEIAPIIIVAVFSWGAYSNPLLSFIYWASSIISIIFAVAFIIMYGLNLKHLS